MNARNLKGTVIASAVIAMFSAAVQAADAGHEKGGGEVKCAGINSCKGTGACASARNSCNGQNSCKGQGWVPTHSEKECKDKGGTVVAKK